MDLLGDMALFIAVARAKNFSAAAKATAVPLSSLSRRISSMESRLGVRLLNRSSRKVQLTEQGHIFLERARSIVDAVRSAQDEVQGVAAHPGGRLRVSMPGGFGEQFLTPLFVAYTNRFPDVTFEFDLSPRLVDLVAENFDVAIRMGTLADSTLTTRKIADVRMGLFASPEYLRRFGEPGEPRELVEHSCLRMMRASSSEGTWSLQSGRAHVSVSVSGRAAANSPSMLRRMTLLAMGISALDEMFVVDDLEAGTLQRVLADWRPPPVPVWAVTQSKMLPAKTRLLLECLRDHIALVRERIDKVAPGHVALLPKLPPAKPTRRARRHGG
jgi:DNA-binding transcriptional LysR family regulator